MNLFRENIEGNIYSGDTISGIFPYQYASNVTISGWTNISSIENWSEFGEYSGMKHYDIRLEIKEIYETSSWSACTVDEQKIISSLFLVDKDKRDEVLTQEEQDINNHFMIYHFISDDVVERMGEINFFTTPKSINYKMDLSIRLHPELFFSDEGWLVKVIYYEKLIITLDNYGFRVFNYTTPVVKYDANYVVDFDGYVTERVITRVWARMCGGWDEDVKTSIKFYEPVLARVEGVKRRRNLINNLLISTIGLIIITEPTLNNVSDAETHAIPFMHEMEAAIGAYYESGSKKDINGNPCAMVEIITSSTYGPLDNFVPGTDDTVTIRMYLLSKINI